MSEQAETLDARVDNLEQRVDDLEQFQRQHDGPTVGELVRVVVLDPNYDEDRDPFARIDGRPTFIRCPDGVDPGLGDSVRVRIADVREDVIVAVAVEDA